MIAQAGVLAWLTGIAALSAVTIWSGLEAVAHAVASVGWGIALVVMVRAVTVSVAGIGWWLLFPSKTRPQLRTCVVLRFIREAANVLLPMAQIGGDLIGAGLLTRYAVPRALAAASVVVDVLVQAATQFLFAVVGLLLLVALGADATVARIAAIGLGLAGVLLAAFYLAQRDGGHRILRAAIGRLAGDRKWRMLGSIDSLYQNLATIYAARSHLAASIVVHMAGWIFGVAEVLIVFACMGHPVSLAEALIIESLLHAIRGAAFAIPGALGAQEGGLVLLCSIFGIPPEQAIALSLVKRAADLALGGPGLVGWQMLEWGRLMPKYALRVRQPRRVPQSGPLSRHMVLFWSSVTVSVIAAVGCGYLVVAAITVGRFARGGLRTGPVTTPDVTILKPLHGSEPGLLENLASFCSQDYAGRIQIICGVQDPNDAAVAVVERLRSGAGSARFRSRDRTQGARVESQGLQPRQHGAGASVTTSSSSPTATFGSTATICRGSSRRCNAPVAV